MTRQRDLKALIRERMAKTGESYMAARRRLEAEVADPKWNPLIRTKRREARELLARALAVEPRLCSNGIGSRDDEHFESSRAQLATALPEIAAAADWIRLQRRTKGFNTRTTSYGYKHHVEQWFDRRGGPHQYVSNGSFIAAAIGLGWDTKPATRHNVYFRFSQQSINELDRGIDRNDSGKISSHDAHLQRSAEVWARHVQTGFPDGLREWTRLDDIVKVLTDAIASGAFLTAYWLDDRGGDTGVDHVRCNREPGCLEFGPEGGVARIIKPKVLRLEVFPGAHSYLWLDSAALEPAFSDESPQSDDEYLTDLDSHYVSGSCWEVGALSIGEDDECKPLPPNARPVTRQLRPCSFVFGVHGTPHLDSFIDFHSRPPPSAAEFRELYARVVRRVLAQ